MSERLRIPGAVARWCLYDEPGSERAQEIRDAGGEFVWTRGRRSLEITGGDFVAELVRKDLDFYGDRDQWKGDGHGRVVGDTRRLLAKLFPDPQRYRVTLLCRCAADYAEGYGPTATRAFENAYRFFREGGHKGDPADEILERVTADGSHYETLEGIDR